jgi:NTE family protein
LTKIEEMAANLSLRDMARLFLPTFDRGGFIDGDRVRKFLKPYLSEKRIEDCHPRFSCVATDLTAGERVVFKDGDLLDAIRASIAIPSIFTPATYGDKVLVDGGVIEPLPIDLAFEMGATFVIAVNTNRSRLKNPREQAFKKETRPSKMEVFMSSLMILESKLMSYQIRDTGPHMLVEPVLGGIEIHHFNKGGNAILAGTSAMQEAMPKVRALF